ncbi:hypothetical protein QYF36_017110 [Acer negundo]|nr:hypothetical protein QYF36_017110 [Acer negundo]
MSGREKYGADKVVIVDVAITEVPVPEVFVDTVVLKDIRAHSCTINVINAINELKQSVMEESQQVGIMEPIIYKVTKGLEDMPDVVTQQKDNVEHIKSLYLIALGKPNSKEIKPLKSSPSLNVIGKRSSDDELEMEESYQKKGKVVGFSNPR